MISGLCDKVLVVKKDQSRDIANIGLKTVIAEIHGGGLAVSAAAKLSQRLLSGIQSKVSSSGLSSTFRKRRQRAAVNMKGHCFMPPAWQAVSARPHAQQQQQQPRAMAWMGEKGYCYGAALCAAWKHQ